VREVAGQPAGRLSYPKGTSPANSPFTVEAQMVANVAETTTNQSTAVFYLPALMNVTPNFAFD
jgi:hypothetical protein